MLGIIFHYIETLGPKTPVEGIGFPADYAQVHFNINLIED